MPNTDVTECRKPQFVAKGIMVVLHEIHMNIEHQIAVRDRAKDLIFRQSERRGEGERLSNESHEIAARVIAGLCRWHMAPEECALHMDEVFHEALQLLQYVVANESTADYFEWLAVASSVRGARK